MPKSNLDWLLACASVVVFTACAPEGAAPPVDRSAPLACGPGTHVNGGLCVADPPPLRCGVGAHPDGTGQECLSDEPALVCAPGTHEDASRCVPDYPKIVCAEGTHARADGKACVADDPELACAAGTHEEAHTCVPDYPKLVCADGTHADGEACVPDYRKLVCGPGTVEQRGSCELQRPPQTCGAGTVVRGTTCVSLAAQEVPMPFQAGFSTWSAQGFHGDFSHTGPDMYAVDFGASIGTPVAAMRGGQVVGVRDDSNVGCASSACAADGNFVIVDHGDGTLAQYWHIDHGGARVTLGDVVCAGQTLALTGNTGWSNGPHLHVEIDDFLGQSLPLRFVEVPGQVPFAGTWFTSSNAAPSSCPTFEEIAPSTCPVDLFGFMGVALDPGLPCSVLSRDRTYALTGRALGSSPNVVIAIKNPSRDWVYDCARVQPDGRFRYDLRFPSTSFEGQAFFMVSAADDSCRTFQGWDSSVRLTLVP